jgi:uncharacterized protein
MEWLLYIVAGLFSLLGLVAVASIVVSLPGAWIILGLALIVELVDSLYLPSGDGGSGGATQTFGWWLLGVCAGLALLGEIIEFAAGAAGAKAGGAGKRGMIGALIGGIVGAIGLTILLPIPVVGTLIGALVGTFAGAVIGEVTGEQAKTVKGSVKPAIGATIGRIGGSFAKLCLAFAIWIALSVAAFWP